jgi:hypothetical protein
MNMMRPLPLYLFLCLLTAAACHKGNTAHRPPTLYGQWRWVESDWTFGPGGGVVHPGDSTVLLQLNSNNSYSVLINGQTAVSDTDTFVYNPNCQEPVCDTFMIFYGPQSNAGFNQFSIWGGYELHIRYDTLSLAANSLNPAGASTTLKFIAYP